MTTANGMGIMRTRNGGTGRAAQWLAVAVLWAWAVCVWGQVRTIVESTRPVPSPDGSRMFVVDHISRIINGEPERYSGRMLVRVTDSQGTVTRQRRIEASQVRLINPPLWLDEHWAAFTYNVSKNANGVVYFNADSGEAVQVEFVAFTRRLAATDTVERELTSFDATLYAGRVLRVSNITRRGRSVFPLLLRPLPPYEINPFPLVFAEQVRAALYAYQEFLEKNKVSDLRLEEATESFNAEETHMAVLACVNDKPSLILATLQAENAADALSKVKVLELDSSLELTCLRDTPDGGEQSNGLDSSAGETSDTEPLGHFGEYRYRTQWRDSQTVLVQKEIFETEDQEPRQETLYEITLGGELRKVDVPTTAAVPQANKSVVGVEDTTVTMVAGGRSAQATETTAPAATKPTRPTVKPTAPSATLRQTERVESRKSPRVAQTPRPKATTRIEPANVRRSSSEAKTPAKTPTKTSASKATPKATPKR